MFRILLQIYIVFVSYYVIVESISSTSIVRLTCDAHELMANKSCVGTFILPNIAVTTAYCAQNCQYVNDKPIRKVYAHYHHNNYVKGNYLFPRNDVGLVVIGSKTKKRNKIVKLSALDAVSSVGLKALIPVLDGREPQLEVHIVEKCDKGLNIPRGYYVCTANKLTGSCREREELGVPLLLDDKIFALSGLASEHQCRLPQKVFIAIGPALSWIGSTLKKLRYTNYERLPDVHKETIIFRKKYFGDQRHWQPAILRSSTPRALKAKSTKYSDTTQFVATTAIKFIPRGPRTKFTPKTIKTVTVLKNSEITLANTAASESWTNLSTASTMSPDAASPAGIVLPPPNNITSTAPSMLLKNLTTLTSLISSYVCSSTTTFSSNSTARTALSSPTTSSASSVSPIILATPSSVVSSTSKPSTLTTSSLKNATNIMDWFNEKLKLNLRIGTPPVLIVGSTTRTSISNRTTLFVDLT